MEKLLARATAQSPQALTEQNTDPFSGVWVNELGSQMQLQVQNGYGYIQGTYITAVGPDAGKPFNLVGFVQGQLITFTVNFTGNANALTSWSGRIDPTTGKLFTLWYLVMDAAVWESISAGSDEFSFQGVNQ